MPPRNQLIRFFALAGLYFAILIAPWPGVERSYAALFRLGGDVFFSKTFWFWPDARVRFVDLLAPDVNGRISAVVPGALPADFLHPRATGVKDTLMVLMNRRQPQQFGLVRTGSRYIAYAPTVMILALILATPIVMARRLRTLVWGLVWIHVFITLRLTITLLAKGFAADKSYALFYPGDFWTSTLGRIETVVSDDPTVSFVVPAILWMVLAMRHWRRALDSGAASNVNRTSKKHKNGYW